MIKLMIGDTLLWVLNFLGYSILFFQLVTILDVLRFFPLPFLMSQSFFFQAYQCHGSRDSLTLNSQTSPYRWSLWQKTKVMFSRPTINRPSLSIGMFPDDNSSLNPYLNYLTVAWKDKCSIAHSTHKFMSYHALPPFYKAFVNCSFSYLNSSFSLRSTISSLRDSDLKDESIAPRQKHTWEIVDLPTRKDLVGHGWV